MSILIKDIDLPKDDKPLNLEIYSDGHIWINWGPEYERKDNVAIQIDRPHGRLIDGDKLADNLQADGEEFGEDLKLNCASWLRSNANAVILEAEE